MIEPHDPTRAAAPVPDRAARFSRSEIEAVCTKAARGAGLAWGLAEEAGMAARRLAEAGLPGPEWLLAYLEDERGVAPSMDGRRWYGAGGHALCPLATGAALSDRAPHLDAQLALVTVAHPGLLLPFLSLAAPAHRALRLDWGPGSALAGAVGIAAPPHMPERAEVLISVTHELPEPASQSGRVVALELWRRLSSLMLATTVPATEQSRTGAGAGTHDND